MPRRQLTSSDASVRHWQEQVGELQASEVSRALIWEQQLLAHAQEYAQVQLPSCLSAATAACQLAGKGASQFNASCARAAAAAHINREQVCGHLPRKMGEP